MIVRAIIDLCLFICIDIILYIHNYFILPKSRAFLICTLDLCNDTAAV